MINETDTPLQAELRGRLFDGISQDPADIGLAALLDRRLSEELAGTVELIANVDFDRPLFLRADDFSALMSCERFFLARHAEEFAWNVPKARPRMTHETIRRFSRRSPAAPFDPYAAASDTLEELAGSLSTETGLKAFLDGLGVTERSDLIESVATAVSSFVEGWPSAAGSHGFRVRERYERHLAGRAVKISATVPFRFGKNWRGPNGVTSEVVLLNVRPGTESEFEERQTRFLWALLETLKNGVPPARVATWYLDSNELDVDDVNRDILESAAARIVAGVQIAVRVAVLGDPPNERPGARCGYCPDLASCVLGSAHLAGPRTR